jgi:hypothetical protein
LEERPPIWRVAANVLKKQSRTADKGGPPDWGLGERLTTPHRENVFLLRNIHRQSVGPGLGRPKRRWEDNIKMDLKELGCGVMDWIEVAQDRGRWWALENAVMNLRVP